MKVLTIDGAEYRLPAANDGTLQRQILAAARQAAQRSRPDPLAETIALVKDLAPEVQAELCKEALARKFARDDAHLSLDERRARQQADIEEYVTSLEGLEQFLLLLWRRHQPELTVEQIWNLHGRATEKHGEKYFDGDA